MTINFQLPKKSSLKPQIAVFGVGGAGCNAVNNMINAGLEGVDFVVANTDAQALDNSLAEKRIQLGVGITQGLGAGSYPEVGKAAAEESIDEIIDHIQGCHMVFITAGMGGGTGTGAAPMIAKVAKDMGILTVSVVTKPFHFEGTHRMRVADLGLQEIQKFVDTFIVIPNQNLFRIADKKTTFADAFKMADDVLLSGVRSVTDLMVMPGLINLDFADVRSVMSSMGKAMMGTGEAEGDKRAVEAAEAAIANPLLDNVSMQGAKGVLINITGGPDMTLFEVDEAANRIRDEVDDNANIIFGSTFSKELEGRIRVSVVATGIDSDGDRKLRPAAEMFGFTKTEEQEQSQPARAEHKENLYERAVVKEEIYQETSFSDPKDEITEKLAEIGFAAPEPIEPEMPVAERTVISETYQQNDEYEERVSVKETVSVQKPAQQKGFSFFKASSFFKSEEKPKSEVKERHSTREVNISISQHSDPKPSIKRVEEYDAQDSFDIPAFIRRNKSNYLFYNNNRRLL